MHIKENKLNMLTEDEQSKDERERDGEKRTAVSLVSPQ
jgi:hypothetical protein